MKIYIDYLYLVIAMAIAVLCVSTLLSSMGRPIKYLLF